MACNILSARLKRLVARGILERRVAAEDARRVEYRLTEKGRDLFPVMMALRQWGDRWVIGVERAPVIVVERESSQPIAELCVTSRDARPLRPSDARMTPAPGATAATKQRLSH